MADENESKEKESKEKKPSALAQILIAVAIAVLAGGTAPWWWKELVNREEKPDQQISPESGQGERDRAGDQPAKERPREKTAEETIRRKFSALAAEFFEKPVPEFEKFTVSMSEGGATVFMSWQYEPQPGVFDFLGFVTGKLGGGAANSLNAFQSAMTTSSLQLKWPNLQPGELAYQLPPAEKPDESIRRKFEAMAEEYFEKPVPKFEKFTVSVEDGGTAVFMYWEYEPKPGVLEFLKFLKRRIGRGAVNSATEFQPAMTPSSLELRWPNLQPGELAYQLP